MILADLKKSFLKVPFICGLITFLIGALGLLGWHLDIGWMKSAYPGFISMKVNSALGFVSLALSQIVLSSSRRREAKMMAFFLASLSGVMGALTIYQYIAGANLGIDEFFYQDIGAGISPSGRLAPITATIFVMMAVGVLITAKKKKPFHKTAQCLFLISGMISVHVLLEYIVRMHGFFGKDGHASMSVHTAFGFVLLNIGFLYMNPFHGYMRMLLSRGRAGMLSRTLVIALFFAPPLIRFAVDFGERIDLVAEDSVPVVRTLLTLSFFMVLVLRSLQELIVRERQKRRLDRSWVRQEKHRARLIANQKLAEEALANETRMRAIFDIGYAAIIGFRENGEITDWNLQAERVFGWTKKEAVGKNFIDALFPDDLRDIMRRRFRLITDFTKTEETKKIPEVTMLRKNNSLFPAQVGVTPIYLNGDLLILTSIEDIAERKNTEKELIRTRQEALVASRAKSEFLANMSHEIRTPMNGIIGMATMLAGEQLTTQQYGQVEIIRKSAESLVSLINGILDHSRIESGILTLDTQDFDLKEMVEDTVAMFRFLAMEKQIDLKLELNLHGRRYIHADANRIRQILVNLIGNAIKFTEKGSVSVRGGISEVRTPDMRLWFEIRDTGSGISQQDVGLLFMANAQTEEGRKKGGAGLGLYISRRLVEIMGGTISVQSEPDKGSCFSFYIDARLGLAPSKSVGIQKLPDFAGLRVLVVEDQPINQQVAVSYLKKLSIDAVVAENGLEALELFEKDNYDLILMDCRMPVMTGEEATRKIRSWEKIKHRPAVPILGLSAEVSIKDRDICLASGMNDFLSKPLDFDRLVKALAENVKPRWPTRMIDHRSIDNLLRYASDGPDLLQTLIEDFEKVSEQTIIDMSLAATDKRLKKISDLAHAMKSACATLGAHSASRLCAEMEKWESIPEDVKDRIFDLDRQFAKVKTELHEYVSSRVS